MPGRLRSSHGRQISKWPTAFGVALPPRVANERQHTLMKRGGHIPSAWPSCLALLLGPPTPAWQHCLPAQANMAPEVSHIKCIHPNRHAITHTESPFMNSSGRSVTMVSRIHTSS